MASYDEVTANKPLKFRLAYIADLEATFTPSFKMMLDNEETLFRPGDERVASLLMWHFVEEVEHRSSALVIYDAVVGVPWYRIRALPAIVKHLLQVMAIIADGVNAHIPEAERKVDARTLLPTFGMRQAFLQKIPFGGRWSPTTPSAFSPVPRTERLVAAGRVLQSQTPFHNPDRGGDVTRWYTGELVDLRPPRP